MASKSNVTKLFEYMTFIGKLKNLKRTGWVRHGVKQPESVADHMYRVAMMAMLAPSKLDIDRCVKMALAHDMAECIVGDLTPHDDVSKDEKFKQEEAATRKICDLLGEELGSQLYTLWKEYEYQDTDEAKFVKDLDRFDMVMQAFEYEQKEERPGFLQEFFDSTEGKFSTDIVQAWKQHLDDVRRWSLAVPSGNPESSSKPGFQDNSLQEISNKKTSDMNSIVTCSKSDSKS